MSRPSTLVAHAALSSDEVKERLRRWSSRQRPRFDSYDIERIAVAHAQAVDMAAEAIQLADAIECIQRARDLILNHHTPIESIIPKLDEILETLLEKYAAPFMVVGWRLFRPTTHPFPTTFVVCLGRAFVPGGDNDSDCVRIAKQRIVDVLVALGEKASRRVLGKVVLSILAPPSRVSRKCKRAALPDGVSAHQRLLIARAQYHLVAMLEHAE